MIPWLKSWSVALVLCLAGASAPSLAAEPIPAEDFFKWPLIDNVAISPNGKQLAMLAPGGDQAGRRVLAVAPVDAPQKLVVVASFKDADVRSFQWINDERLVFDAIDLQKPGAEQWGSGLYAVNIDSTDFVWLVGRGYGEESKLAVAKRPLRANHVLYSVIRDGSDDVILTRFDIGSDPLTTRLVRLNTKTKATTELMPFGVPDGANAWLLDRALRPRAVVAVEKGVARILYRGAVDEEWTELSRYNVYDGQERQMVPLALDGDNKLYVRLRTSDAAGTMALYRMDVKTKAVEKEPLLSLEGYDFEGRIVQDRRSSKVLGMTFETDAEGAVWLDPTMKAAQELVDAKLPSTVNVLQCQDCPRDANFVVKSYSDQQSPVYFTLNRASGELKLIGASRPWMDSKRMGQSEVVRVAVRDGLQVPVQVTKPQGTGPWPAVVLVHGGPYVRGVNWGWDSDAQFLASRGYLVIEPEFRGSTGYGWRHYKAGWKQWGLTMQDDVTDVTQWAVKQGWADPKRLVIAGASYGGYSALMGLVREPNLYRAAINWVGVTDIGLMYTVGYSDFLGTDWSTYGMPRLIGDPKTDEKQLNDTSPLKQAARITKPVFMAYGLEDRRVPLVHGEKMRDALQKEGKVPVEWTTYEGEGHGWLLVKNRVDFWTRVEKFLAVHTK